MLHSRNIIWLEFMLVAIPTTLGAAYLVMLTISILTHQVYESSSQGALLWLVPVGTIIGIAALWMMFFGIIKDRKISRLVVYGFAAGIAVVIFTGATGFDPRYSPWWTLPIRLFLNLGLPYALVGWHWLYLLKKKGLIAAQNRS